MALLLPLVETPTYSCTTPDLPEYLSNNSPPRIMSPCLAHMYASASPTGSNGAPAYVACMLLSLAVVSIISILLQTWRALFGADALA